MSTFADVDTSNLNTQPGRISPKKVARKKMSTTLDLQALKRAASLDTPRKRMNKLAAEKRIGGKKIEVKELDLTRVRIIDWLLKNMQNILNIIRSNSQRRKEEQANIYGSTNRNSEDAERMIAHCIYLVKLLEDFELVYVFFKIYGLTL